MADDEEGAGSAADGPTVDRAGLSESAAGRAIASEFIALFGTFVTEQVRPVMREVAADGGEPQQLMDGLADLLRSVAESIESGAADRDRPPGSGRSES
jgi:predicted component of type VI protein secretion system